jgi:hypothetical protein
MTFLQSFDIARRLAADPRGEMRTWRDRTAFRQGLDRLIEMPHLAKDLGFDLPALAAERMRRPWEPVRLRRGPAVAGTLAPAEPTLHRHLPASGMPAAR